MNTGKTARSRSRGFTILELMIVLSIIVSLTVAALPDLLSGRHSSRIKSATDSVMNVFQFAKVRAANDFNAYGVMMDNGAGTGRLQVFEGSGPNCGSLTWASAVKTLDFTLDFGLPEGDIRVLQLTPDNVTRLCFTPDGRLLDAQTNQPVPSGDANYGAGEFIVSIQGHRNDIPMGLMHHVIVSYAGKTRYTFGKEPQGPEGEGGP